MKYLYENTVVYRGSCTPLSKIKQYSKKQIKIYCPECKKEFKKYIFKLFETCSFLCQKCSLNEIHSKELEVGYKNNMLTVIKPTKTGYSLAQCECGTIKEIKSTSIRNGLTKSCGCLVSSKLKEWRKQNPNLNKRENHPMWKGGITDVRRCLMTTTKYKEWRKSIFERDNYTCQKCKKQSRELNAHHIDNYADNKDKSMDTNNGVTLCKNCHNEFHIIYGRRNTNINQLIKFLLA